MSKRPSVFSKWVQHRGPQGPVETLLVVCTDPELDNTLLAEFAAVPHLLWRCPGPAIPPSGSSGRQTEELLQHVLEKYPLREIVICGHLPCGVVQELVKRNPEQTDEPVCSGLGSAVRLVEQKHRSVAPDRLVELVVEENVLLQSANLRTYPCILSAVAEGSLELHSWIYDQEHEVLYVRGHQPCLLLNRSGRFALPQPELRPWNDPSEIYLA